MYSPAHFEEHRSEVLLDLIRQHPLAAIVSAGPDGLVADHIPLLHEPAAGSAGKLIGHVARSNPLWQAPPDREHLILFQGPSAYISPNWYATKAESGKVVPTWNYAVAHVTATIRAFHEPEALLELLGKLTDRHEASQPRPWRVADAPPDFTSKLLASIVGIELRILRMQGKWKVSQNQSAENRAGVVAGLRDMAADGAQDMATLVEGFDPAKRREKPA